VPTLGTLAAGIQSVSAVRRSEVYITELGDDDLPIIESGVPQWRKFQYFPESVADTKQVNYQPKEVPGGSLPLYQYTGSGERTLAFTAYFTTDVDHLVNQRSIDFDARPIGGTLGDQTLPLVATRTSTVSDAVEDSRNRMVASGAQHRNPFIPGALVWLRRFMFPRYGETAEIGVPLTKPPHKLLLHFTGSEIERLGGGGGFSVGGGGILCGMTTCDINIEAFFPSGNIRIASVSLSFAEVPQRGGSVKFPSAEPLDTVANDWYQLTASAWNTTSGG